MASVRHCNSQLIIFIEYLINSIVSTVSGDKSVRRYESILYAGPKSARNILKNLRPKPVRPEMSGPTYNSGSDNPRTSYVLQWPAQNLSVSVKPGCVPQHYVKSV